MEYKKWSRNYNSCVKCEKTEFRHKGHGLCLSCYNKSEYRKINSSKWKASNKGKYWYHKNDQKLKQKAIEYYSKGKNCCGICGFSDARALVIDHINNNGHNHRKTFNTTINSWLSKNNYPEGFQILCCNCNWIKEVERRKKQSNYFLKNNV